MPRPKNKTEKEKALIEFLNPTNAMYSSQSYKSIMEYAKRTNTPLKAETVMVTEEYMNEEPKTSKIIKVTIQP